MYGGIWTPRHAVQREMESDSISSLPLAERMCLSGSRVPPPGSSGFRVETASYWESSQHNMIHNQRMNVKTGKNVWYVPEPIRYITEMSCVPFERPLFS